MSLLTIFLYGVGFIVVFGTLGWLINQWVPDTMKKLAWSALVVLAVIIFLMFIFGGLGINNGGLSLHR